MDSYQRLIEDLPARLPPGRSRRAGEKAIRERVAALPLANPAQAAREVEQILDGMLATTWAGGDRLAALEHVRVAAENLCAGIERQLASEPHPLSGTAAAWADVAQNLHGKLVSGYAVGLHELCAPDGRLPRFKARAAALAAVRGLVHAERVLVWSFRRYQAAPAGLWRRIHALHAFAGELGVAAEIVDDALADGVPLSARSAYAHVLILSMSNPYRLSTRELQDARLAIRCVAGHCNLAGTGIDEGIQVDTESDHGPGYIADGPSAESGTVLALDVTPAHRLVEERIAGLAPDGDVIHLPQPGGGYFTTSASFLERLCSAWAVAPRGHPRLEATHALEFVVGMHALHYVLAGNTEFATFVRAVRGDAITIGAQELASAWLAASDTLRPQVFRGDVLDQSEGGYRLRLHEMDGLRVRVGELVGLAPMSEELDERDWMVGVIRWLRHEAGDLLLGVELLRREARAAGLRPVTADGDELPPLRAVELLEGEDARQLSLLVTHRLARNVVAAEVVLPALSSDWNSRASVATWRTGPTEALGPSCFRVTMEREASLDA